MNKLKVVTVVGTRPEIIRLSQVIKKCDVYFDHILIHTGQNWDYTLNEIFFRDLDLRKPDYFLNVAEKDLGATIGNIISRTYKLFREIQPDALLILGDTNSTLCALGAKRLKIPVFHMEAGNRCFDQNVPEEINRKIIDHLSDINLAYTEHSRRYLIQEGIRKEHVFVTGSPMTEVLYVNRENIDGSKILKTLGIEKDKYIVVSMHREENVDNKKSFELLVNSINKVAVTYGYPIIFSTHPRTRRRIAEQNVYFDKLVKNIEPLGFFDYLKLQRNSFCVLSDSGTLSEESAILNFPAVLIRTSTERPEVLDKGTIIIGGLESENVLQAIETARGIYLNGMQASLPQDYKDINVSEKVVKLIQSYTHIVNRVIWNK